MSTGIVLSAQTLSLVLGFGVVIFVPVGYFAWRVDRRKWTWCFGDEETSALLMKTALVYGGFALYLYLVYWLCAPYLAGKPIL